MKILKFLVLILVVTTSCTRKSVKLPVLNVQGIQDTIYDNSQIWIFFKENNGDTIAELNKNNTISTTNWIFNIDRRLPLKKVIPDLKASLEKKEKPSMHESATPVYNYFSYVDTVSNRLSTIQIDSINYVIDSRFNSFETNEESTNKHVWINYKKDGLYINDSLIDITEIKGYLAQLTDSVKTKVHLRFDKNVLYQDYIHLKAILQQCEKPSLLVDNKEYINLN